MTEDMATAIERLKALPEETQKDLGPRLNQYLNKLEDLRALIQEGLNSGPPRPAEEVFSRLEARYQVMRSKQSA